MRLLALLLVSVFACAACARSHAPASTATSHGESSKLRVRFKSAFADPPASPSMREASDVRAAMDAEHAVVEHLRRSGYDVVDSGPWDLRMTLEIRVLRDERADATAVFYDPKDRVVDRISLTTEPKRVPYGIVDGLRDSKKLSSYADSRKAKR